MQRKWAGIKEQFQHPGSNIRQWQIILAHEGGNQCHQMHWHTTGGGGGGRSQGQTADSLGPNRGERPDNERRRARASERQRDEMVKGREC